MKNTGVYNPLDRENLGRSVAEALLESPPIALADLARFPGAGIYAIYYTGDFPAYAELAARNTAENLSAPIYVGKAIPAGGRKGGTRTDNPARQKATAPAPLFKRLKEHEESIKATSNLRVGDFKCRFLVVEDIWIPLGESLLISKFSPVWNLLIDGFGNHTPGKGRFEGMRPRWDVLHPGRSWAKECKDRPETAAQIAAEVAAHLRAMPLSEAHMFTDVGDGGRNAAATRPKK